MATDLGVAARGGVAVAHVKVGQFDACARHLAAAHAEVASSTHSAKNRSRRACWRRSERGVLLARDLLHQWHLGGAPGHLIDIEG